VTYVVAAYAQITVIRTVASPPRLDRVAAPTGGYGRLALRPSLPSV